MSDIPGKYEGNGVIPFPRREKPLMIDGDLEAPYFIGPPDDSGRGATRTAQVIPFKSGASSSR